MDHNGDQAFKDALDGAVLRRMGESEAWSRRDSHGPIWELIAATVALRAHTYTEIAPAPMALGA